MVRDGYRKGRLFSYLVSMGLAASLVLTPQVSIAAEPAAGNTVSKVTATAKEYIDVLAAESLWLAAAGEGSVVAGVSELFHAAELRSRQFIEVQDRRIRSGLGAWLGPRSAITNQSANTLLSSSDGGLSLGLGIDEFSVDYTVKF